MKRRFVTMALGIALSTSAVAAPRLEAPHLAGRRGEVCTQAFMDVGPSRTVLFACADVEVDRRARRFTLSDWRISTFLGAPTHQAGLHAQAIVPSFVVRSRGQNAALRDVDAVRDGLAAMARERGLELDEMQADSLQLMSLGTANTFWGSLVLADAMEGPTPDTFRILAKGVVDIDLSGLDVELLPRRDTPCPEQTDEACTVDRAEMTVAKARVDGPAGAMRMTLKTGLTTYTRSSDSMPIMVIVDQELQRLDAPDSPTVQLVFRWLIDWEAEGA